MYQFVRSQLLTRKTLRVIDCDARVLIPQPTKRQRIGNQIDSAMIFARADFKHEKAPGHSLNALGTRARKNCRCGRAS